MPGVSATRRRSSRRSRAMRAPTAAHDVLDVVVVLLPGGYTSTAIVPLEVFHSAGVLYESLRGEAPRPRFRVRVASVDGKAVPGLCGLRLQPELALDDVEHVDIIVVTASALTAMDEIARGTPLLPWLRAWYERGAHIASICSAAAFLAESGLLDGRQATTHWGVAEHYRQRYPAVRWRPEQFVTEDRRMLCSGGVYGAADLSLYLVEKFCGRELALQCAKTLLLSMPRRSQAGYAMTPLSPPHADAQIRAAEAFLQEHFASGVPIERLAHAVNMSPRNLMRRFKAATGRVPGEYLQALRIGAARELLERGGASIQEICSRVGYEDHAFFRRVFKRHTGVSPAEYRSRFAGASFEDGERLLG